MAVRKLQNGFVAACDDCGRECQERTRAHDDAQETAVSLWRWTLKGFLLYCPACVQKAARAKAREETCQS
jgi:hypothetical protein